MRFDGFGLLTDWTVFLNVHELFEELAVTLRHLPSQTPALTRTQLLADFVHVETYKSRYVFPAIRKLLEDLLLAQIIHDVT